jgi:U4/U6.U5 tri-snRNP component SNU23
VFLKKAEDRARKEEFGEDIDETKQSTVVVIIKSNLQIDPAVNPEEIKPAQARAEGIDLTSRVGKYQVVSDAAPNAQQPGFYCEPCDCLLKDSVSYLDHINGKKRIN